MTRTEKSYDVFSFKATPERGAGTFEAIVAVMGNVDLQGDRVMPNAFDKSKAKWEKSGDVIPVIWSHEWGDPFAHIGYVDPKDMREVSGMKGIDGGLFITGHLDVDKPFAKQVYDLLAARRVKEFSFAYDIPPGGEQRGKDGANELHELDIIEVGPTLKGANPDTVSLGVKARLDRAAREEHAGSAPQFKWDGGAAMRACKSAADYRKIAFERANDSDPDTAAHWALPHHARPGADADPAGVAAALAALHGGRGGPPDLKNKSGAESHLNSHSGSDEKAMNEFQKFTTTGNGDATVLTISNALREKAGRVIGSKAAADLKARIADAVDEFVNEVNGAGEASGEKTVDEHIREINAQLEELDIR